jgi:Domain of unknown function (DUF1707)
MAEPGDQVAAAAESHGHPQASHAHRDQVIGQLKAAFVQGRLTMDEFVERVGRALAARTYVELVALTADIPAMLTAAQPLRRSARGHSRVSVSKAVNGAACVILVANMGMAAALLSGTGAAVVLVAVFTIIGAALAGWALIAAR